MRKKWISSAVCGLQRSRQSPEEFGAETSFDRPNAVIAKPRRGCGNPFPRYYRLRLCRKHIEFEFATANSNISKFRRRRNYIEFPRQRKYIDARAGVPPVPISAVTEGGSSLFQCPLYSACRRSRYPQYPWRGPFIQMPAPQASPALRDPSFVFGARRRRSHLPPRGRQWLKRRRDGRPRRREEQAPPPLRVWVRSPTIQHRTLLATGNWRLFC